MFVQFKRGLKYALIFMVIAAIMGALFGLISGIILQPAIVSITFVGIFSAINYAVAILSLIPLLVLSLIGKKTVALKRYFALSSGFICVYLPLFILIKYIPVTLY
ncbi:MAG: hypothetical protein MK212_03820 [Saprospiraceae bacterium]|nr:hypothetical protein [Saprospiraceae bacterium]